MGVTRIGAGGEILSRPCRRVERMPHTKSVTNVAWQTCNASEEAGPVGSSVPPNRGQQPPSSSSSLTETDTRKSLSTLRFPSGIISPGRWRRPTNTQPLTICSTSTTSSRTTAYVRRSHYRWPWRPNGKWKHPRFADRGRFERSSGFFAGTRKECYVLTARLAPPSGVRRGFDVPSLPACRRRHPLVFVGGVAR